MSDYMADMSTYINASAGPSGLTAPQTSDKDKTGLDMTDFLTLMVAQFQNQSIDDTADTSEMLNQLVQMQMVQALVNMTDASVMSYAASLVGKEVTVASYNQDGTLNEVVGTVTASGTYGGEQVLFVGDRYYYLNEILAVGRLPEQPVVPETPDEDGGEDDVPPVDSGETVDPEQGADGAEDGTTTPDESGTESGGLPAEGEG